MKTGSPAIADLAVLLHAYKGREANEEPRSLKGLKAQCADACDRNAARFPAPLRSIHHFACSGGTLLSRALAAQANVMLLSEIDPFSKQSSGAGQFAPRDILGHCDIGVRSLQDDLAGDVFLSGLKSLHGHLHRIGRALIIRDHPHSHFCTDQDITARPLMGDLLRSRFRLCKVVTVRHPLDSFLSLSLKGWVHFAPGTLEEYARRYLCFLDSYADSPIFKYEDFVTDPDEVLQRILTALELPVSPRWRDVMPGVTLTGDSGRTGQIIAPRPRREVPDAIAAQEASSPSYVQLCTRLQYNPGFAEPALS